MKEFNNLVSSKNSYMKNGKQNSKTNNFVTYNKTKIILIISFIVLIIILAIIFLFFLVIKKINSKKNLFLNNIDNNSTKIYNNKMKINFEGNYSNNFFNHTINKDNNSNYIETNTKQNEINKNTGSIIKTENILDNININNTYYKKAKEQLAYTIIPTCYTFKKNTKYKMRGYYFEKEDNYQVYIIAGGKDILLEIKKVIIEKGNVTIHITEKFDFRKYILPKYGYTKIKFNKNPEKITIMNNSGKILNHLE